MSPTWAPAMRKETTEFPDTEKGVRKVMVVALPASSADTEYSASDALPEPLNSCVHPAMSSSNPSSGARR